MRSSPAWRSWVSLCELWSAVVVQHQLVSDDVERNDELQLEHSRLFDEVSQYTGLKRPKHHFLTHTALDVWHFGPPRGYWCFGFESFNKVIKAGSQRTNWKNETVGIMQYWSMKSACRMRMPTTSDSCGRDDVCVAHELQSKTPRHALIA